MYLCILKLSVLSRFLPCNPRCDRGPDSSVGLAIVHLNKTRQTLRNLVTCTTCIDNEPTSGNFVGNTCTLTQKLHFVHIL